MALSAAWKLRRPEYAEEVWGEAIVVAIRRHDPRRGLFLAYLNANVRGLIHDLVRANQQTGTSSILADYCGAVRDAEDVLFEKSGRPATDHEIAEYLDLRPGLIGEVRRARAACAHVGGEDLEFLLQHAVDIGSSSEAADDDVHAKRLRDMPKEWREVIYLHFHDHLSVTEIMTETGLSEDAVTSTIERAVDILRGRGEAG